MRGVMFLPRVGAKYEHSRWGKRVMVLGDSHYCADPKDATPDLTQKVFGWVFDPSCAHEGWMNTYTKFASVLSGKQEDRSSSKEVWDEVLFYNYVQEPLSGPRTEPTMEMMEAAQAPFMEVLEQYQPDVVFAWSQSRVYDHLPNAGVQGEPIDGVETWVYTLRNGHKVRVLPVDSPCRISYNGWRPIVKRALSCP